MTIRHPFGMFLLLFLIYQAVTQSENKLPNAQYTSDTHYFYRFWTPYKMTISGADYKMPPTPLTPPLGAGGLKYFWGCYD